MTKRLCAALLVLAGLAAGTVRAADPQKEMQGIWDATKAKVGAAQANPAQLATIHVTIEENKLILDELGKQYTVYFTFPGKGNDIDFYKDKDGKEKLWHGIYEVEGKTLKFCWAPSGQPRPAKFGANKSNDDRDFHFEKKK